MDKVFDSLSSNSQDMDFLEDFIISDLGDDIRHHFGAELTNEIIIATLQEIDKFFNSCYRDCLTYPIDYPIITGLLSSRSEDALVDINYLQQMRIHGITAREAFDLVMTHEGSYRILQGMDTGFNSHQEELCCDYMAGARAGMNGMTEGNLETVARTVESSSYPDGAARVNAIEAGVAFAHDYIEAHNGISPTFGDCFEHFCQTDVCAYGLTQELEQVNLQQDCSFDFHPIDGSHGEIKGIFIDNKVTQLHYAQEAKENAEWHEKRSNDCIARGDLAGAKDHAERAASYRRTERDAIAASKKCIK